MKHLLAILLPAAAFVAGCGDGDGGGEVWVGIEVPAAAPAPPDPWYVRYPDGSPLAAAAPPSWREDELIELINLTRVLNGVDVLTPSLGVGDVARAHAINMDLKGFVGAVNPEGDGPADRAWLVGLDFLFYSGIAGAGTTDPQEMYEAWMFSPAGDVILDPYWTRVGVGYAHGFWASDFLER